MYYIVLLLLANLNNIIIIRTTMTTPSKWQFTSKNMHNLIATGHVYNMVTITTAKRYGGIPVSFASALLICSTNIIRVTRIF